MNQDFLTGLGNERERSDLWEAEVARVTEFGPTPDNRYVPGTYMVSGLAQPGTTIRLTVYDASGEVIGMETVVADTGGNWLASFNGEKITAIPAFVVMDQTAATQNSGFDTGYDLRTYFSPASSTGTYYLEDLTVENVFGKRQAARIADLAEAAGATILMGWNGSSYEFAPRGGTISSSGN